MAARGWTQRDLAAIMGRPVQAVNEIMNGGKQITAETATQLGEALEMSADFWLSLETAYRLSLAGPPPDEIARRRDLYEIAPVGELLRRGWLGRPDGINGLETALFRFLGITTADQLPPMPIAGWRHTSTKDPEPRSQIAWVKRTEGLAREQPVVASFDRERLAADIRGLLATSPEPRPTARSRGSSSIAVSTSYLEVLGSVVSARLSSADDGGNEGTDEQVDERPHRSIAPG